ncbi:unnamed protein product [Spirodela intermedia]|uniref:Uncharacterized protein n=1 Tax=Spirodela intermedia TaxID=51605 RepID=A0A7I8IXH3_SPIIN|nr:unnamed protein product [Spirodela intermedia]CAA6662538.1 unnamed protein product [Spirodela intermedia]
MGFSSFSREGEREEFLEEGGILLAKLSRVGPPHP